MEANRPIRGKFKPKADSPWNRPLTPEVAALVAEAMAHPERGVPRPPRRRTWVLYCGPTAMQRTTDWELAQEWLDADPHGHTIEEA